MSSLSPAALSAGLVAAERAFASGEHDATALVAAARAPIEAEPGARIDYVELRDAEELIPIDRGLTRATRCELDMSKQAD